jgi:RES domain
VSFTPALGHVNWQPCWRLVSSRFPPIGLFDRVADPDDLDIVFAIEGLTNGRLLDEAGDITLVLPEDRISGPGTTPIMAAFTHLNPIGSRFTDGSYGVYYAANTLDTAVAETRFHRSLFLEATNEPPIEVDMRSYAADLDADLHDIRHKQAEIPDIYDPNPSHYAHAQALASALRTAKSNGIVYDSVRYSGGECVALFRPCILSPARQGPHFCYVWDGQEISGVYQKSSYVPNSV